MGQAWSAVGVKTALSLDGRPGTTAGARSAISGSGSLEVTMRLRSAADAVLVGAATALIDDPRLTVRPANETSHQPLRVVLSREHCPEELKMFTDGAGRVLCLSALADPHDWSPPQGVEVAHYSADEGLRGALHALGERGVTSVLVEAGPGLFSSMWREGVIDELVIYHAGGVAGSTAPVLMVDAGDDGDLNRSMRAVEAGVVGGDAITIWRPRSAEEFQRM
jgi:diaminohydroxyphosphoribosylaminopyrimidine deaminase/5-amino-6-(5-phosphoribosylamino)uracil reductase